MDQVDELTKLVLAPYIIKATALIDVERKVGGNQFRHGMATLGILLDYKFFGESVLLKASVIHDLIEEKPETNQQELREIDKEANKVVDLVLEVTRDKKIRKEVYLQTILEKGTRYAKLLKIADRISNLTDLHRDTHPDEKFSDYLDQTEKYVLPMAEKVNQDMVKELKDLIRKRRDLLEKMK